jgi:hypothetical protein
MVHIKKLRSEKTSFFFRLPQVVLLGCTALSPSTTPRTTPPTRAQKTLQQHVEHLKNENFEDSICQLKK